MKKVTKSIIYNKILLNLKQFFIKKGKKTMLEKFWAALLRKTSRKQLNVRMKKLINNSVIFGHLLVRRRGKRMRYKITYPKVSRLQTRALLRIARAIKASNVQKKRFDLHFKDEIKKLSSITNNNNLINQQIDTYKLLFTTMPKRWLKKRRLFNKRKAKRLNKKVNKKIKSNQQLIIKNWKKTLTNQKTKKVSNLMYLLTHK